MIDAIHHLDWLELKWIVHPLQTTDVETVFIRIGSSLVMGVDAANRAEIVFRSPGIELIQTELLCALGDFQASHRNRRHDGAPPAAH